MHTYNQNQVTPVSPTTSLPLGGILAAGLVGAVLTGTVAAAKDIRLVKDGSMETTEAVTNVAKEALGGGLAVAAGATVAKTVFRSGYLGLAAMIAVGIGTKYAYDSLLCKETCKKNTTKTTDSKKSAAKAADKA